jgi:MATE family multidrug resistance protein
VFSYLFVMIPVCWFLALVLEHGVMGLFGGVLIASVVSAGLLCGRFFWLGRRDARRQHLHPDANLG